MKDIAANRNTLCPSARPEWQDSIVFGIIGGTVVEPRVAYLNQSQPVTEELLAKAKPVTPTEVFRTAAPCATKSCQHFDGKDCRLAVRIIEQLPKVTEELSACSIRRDCRWWQQEGKTACMRCPQVITDSYKPSQLIREVATPTAN